MAILASEYPVLLAGCFIKLLELGTFKTLGVFYMPILEDLQTTNIALGTWMAMHNVAVNVFGEFCFVIIVKKPSDQVLT